MDDENLDLHFAIPLGEPSVDPFVVFNNVEFLDQNTAPYAKEPKLAPEDKQWVQSQLQMETPKPEEAPSLPAYRRIKKQLENYNFTLPVTQDQWQSYVMCKYYELTLEDDPKIVKGALDSLAKTSIVGLAVEKTEININTRPTQDLEAELLQAIKRYSNEKVIEGEAIRA